MSKVLIFLRCYLPGDKSGGPVRSIENLVNATHDTARYRIVTNDRDSGDTQPYADISQLGWNPVGHGDVFYVPPDKKTLRTAEDVLREDDSDVLYLNTWSHPFYSLAAIRAHRRLKKSSRIIMAPRGELHPGALAVRRWKKLLLLAGTKATGFFRGIQWHATSEEEADHIRQNYGKNVPVEVISNLVTPPPTRTRPFVRSKPLKITFLSRVVPKKNLLAAIECLQNIDTPVEFDIYGPLEDTAYVNRCQTAAEQVTSTKIEFKGPLKYSEVPEVLGSYDVFLFPTLGENFGHVISEALGAGCVVITSDQTPWRDLQTKNVGWDLPLDRPDLFQDAIEQCATMSEEEFVQMRNAAADFAVQRNAANGAAVKSYLSLFGAN
jgi:glycosyltransferase involved in cell wall biosynthesis